MLKSKCSVRVIDKLNELIPADHKPDTNFKVIIFIPFVDKLHCQLHYLFDERFKEVFFLEGLTPSNFQLYYNDDYILIGRFYLQKMIFFFF